MPLRQVEGHGAARRARLEGCREGRVQGIKPVDKFSVGRNVAAELLHVLVAVFLHPQPELHLLLQARFLADLFIIGLGTGEGAAVGKISTAAVVLGRLDEDDVHPQVRSPGCCAGAHTACAHHQQVAA